jgi:hypothetical protein
VRKEHLRTCVEKKGRSESKSDVTCVEAVEAAAEAEDGGVKGGTAMTAAAARKTPRSDICRTYTMWRL